MQERVQPAYAGPAQPEAARGLAFAMAAYLLWGVLPLYLKAVDHIPLVEIVAHRIVWSVPVAGVVLLALGRTADIRAALRSPRTLLMAALTAALISVNWGLYVWAVVSEHTVEAALGYYINPLMSVLLGALLLGERLNGLQMVAIGLAMVAIAVMALDAGGLPWISLALAACFALYGYLRKTLPIGPTQGFFLEVLILSLPCLAYIMWIEAAGTGHFLTGGAVNIGLLLLSGPATAVPLILYASGAKLLRISTLGMMQYIAPTMVALIAVFVFGEPFGTARAIAFTLIGAALVLYSWPMVFGGRDRSR